LLRPEVTPTVAAGEEMAGRTLATGFEAIELLAQSESRRSDDAEP
jgi:hypothetical protein